MSGSLAVMVALALVGAGCTSSSGGSEDDGGGGGGGGGGQVTLRLWAFEGEEAFFPTLIERFEAEHPDVTIEVTEIPEDNYRTKVDTALAAGSPPDLGLVYEPRWFKAGAVLPLDDVVESEGIDLSSFNQNAMSGCRYEGQVYCVGSYTGSVLLFYNRELFDAAGIAYPSTTEPMTIDEFASVAAQISRPSDDLSERIWGTIGEAPFWWSDPVTHFSDDGHTTDGLINDPATVHLYDVMSGLVRDGFAPTGSEFDLLGTEDLLAAGQVGMAINDNLVAIEALEGAGIDWGAAPVPVESPGSPAYVSSWTDQIGVFSASEHPEEAKLFAAFVASEGSELRVEVADQLPLDTSVPGAESWAATNQGRADVVEVVSQAREAVFVPGFWDVTSPLWDAFDAMSAGDETAQQSLNDVAPILQENLDRAWETWEAIA
ncbi:MAG: ABC transporter substrate-binding protein [Actinomycetota bacterium]